MQPALWLSWRGIQDQRPSFLWFLAYLLSQYLLLYMGFWVMTTAVAYSVMVALVCCANVSIPSTFIDLFVVCYISFCKMLGMLSINPFICYFSLVFVLKDLASRVWLSFTCYLLRTFRIHVKGFKIDINLGFM